MVVPENLKIKIAERSDTYTGKLGFINFMKSEKEWKFKASYDNWGNDPKTKEKEFLNEPTSGFVINSNVGGRGSYYSDYGRDTKIRVWDPRGWEIEITLRNFFEDILPLGVTAGKGIEQELVYGFDGLVLNLIPYNSPKTKEIMNTQSGNISLPNDVESIPFNSENVYELGKVYGVLTNKEVVNYYVYAGKQFYANTDTPKYGKGNGVVKRNIFFALTNELSIKLNSWEINGKPFNKPSEHTNKLNKKDIKIVSKDMIFSKEELEEYTLHELDYQLFDIENIFNKVSTIDYIDNSTGVLHHLKDGKKILFYAYNKRYINNMNSLTSMIPRVSSFETSSFVIFTPVKDTGKYILKTYNSVSNVEPLFKNMGIDIMNTKQYVDYSEMVTFTKQKEIQKDLLYYRSLK